MRTLFKSRLAKFRGTSTGADRKGCATRRRRTAFGLALLIATLALTAAAGLIHSSVPAVRAQLQPPPPPTIPTLPVTPTVPISSTPALPVPLQLELAGRWSITRTWYRSCPRCGFPIVRTTPWVITQTLGAVRVDRGPRGGLAYAPDGSVFLDLSGAETEGFTVLRFWYGSLRVSPDGNAFEGGFNGSEQLGNPCGDAPPEVTCFAQAGWLRARRLDVTPVPMPPGPPTPIATAAATSTSTPLPTSTATSAPTSTSNATSTPSATMLPAATPTPNATASETPTPTRMPPWRSYLPAVGDE